MWAYALRGLNCERPRIEHFYEGVASCTAGIDFPVAWFQDRASLFGEVLACGNLPTTLNTDEDSPCLVDWGERKPR
jgi:hypothetical protein